LMIAVSNPLTGFCCSIFLFLIFSFNPFFSIFFTFDL
jgi:hypothetical protein